MKLKELPLKVGAILKESRDTPPPSNWIAMGSAILKSADPPVPLRDPSLVVTINVLHPQYTRLIPANLDVPSLEVQRRLYETLQTQTDRQLSEIGEVDFDFD